MPFAKFMYNAARAAWGVEGITSTHVEWEFLTQAQQEKWEEYSRICSAYFMP
jgi:hypothetical protein